MGDAAAVLAADFGPAAIDDGRRGEAGELAVVLTALPRRSRGTAIVRELVVDQLYP